jgi:tryptophan synthase alpha chain
MTKKTSLIEKTFARCHAEGRAAFVAFLTAGDPNYADSLRIALKVARSGADILELGLPFSDPLADGETNQNAAARALAAGINSTKVLELVKALKKELPELPVVLYTYLNPVAYAGDFGDFCRRAVASGVDAILPLDLPPEEAKDHRAAMAESATSFIYYVSREGVTGERKEFATGVGAKIASIRKRSALPVVVGFGISTPEHVKAAAASGVDGVVVGSAIVKKVEAFSQGKSSVEEIGAFVATLSGALKKS